MSDQHQEALGVVIYRRGGEPGTLQADWAVSTQDGRVACKGLATGGPAAGFVGDYAITYYDIHGEPGEPYDLAIRSSGEVFHLAWSKGDQPLYRGIGLLRDGALVAGWSPVR